MIFPLWEGELKNIIVLIIAVFFLTTGPSFADNNDDYLKGTMNLTGTEQAKDGASSAGTGQEAPQPAQEIGAVDTGDFITMIISLAVVVGVIYAIFYVVKKGVGKKIVENQVISIVGSKIISGSKALHVVEVGKTMYLIGSSNESINLISEISDKETRDTLKLQATQNKQAPVRFQDFIANLFRRDTRKQLEIAETADFMKQQRNRLKRMKEQ